MPSSSSESVTYTMRRGARSRFDFARAGSGPRLDRTDQNDGEFLLSLVTGSWRDTRSQGSAHCAEMEEPLVTWHISKLGWCLALSLIVGCASARLEPAPGALKVPNKPRA